MKAVNLEVMMPKKPKFIKQTTKLFNDNVLLINPNVDASDKEILIRNNFKSNSKALVNFIKNGSQQAIS